MFTSGGKAGFGAGEGIEAGAGSGSGGVDYLGEMEY
jgi:hypothetical protein